MKEEIKPYFLDFYFSSCVHFTTWNRPENESLSIAFLVVVPSWLLDEFVIEECIVVAFRLFAGDVSV